MDRELIAYLDEHFREMSQQMEGLRQEFGGLREETSQKLDELREENRHTRVVVEGLRSDLQLLAEGVMANEEKASVRHAEMILEIEKVKVSIAPYYQNLDQRVSRLEQWADRQGRDAMELIREKFGKR